MVKRCGKGEPAEGTSLRASGGSRPVGGRGIRFMAGVWGGRGGVVVGFLEFRVDLGREGGQDILWEVVYCAKSRSVSRLPKRAQWA